MRTIAGLVTAAAISSALALPGVAQDMPTTFTYYGLDLGPTAETAYAGALVALNGDFAHSGFVFRTLGMYSNYNYHSASVGEVNGQLTSIDAMIGYHLMTSNWWSILGYIGVEDQNQRLSPFDPANRASGNEVGLKIAADITPYVGPDWYVNLMGSYSTAFDSYWSRFRVGRNFGKVTIGPELQFNGNEVFDEQRIGGFVDFRFSEPWAHATLSAGYDFNNGDGIFGGTQGGYVAVNIGMGF